MGMTVYRKTRAPRPITDDDVETPRTVAELAGSAVDTDDSDSDSDSNDDPSAEVIVPTHFQIDSTTPPTPAPLAWLDARSVTIQFRDTDVVVTGVVHRTLNVSYERIALEFVTYSAEGEVLASDDYGIDCETARGSILPFRRTFSAGQEAFRRGTRVEVRVAVKAFDLTPPVCATVVHT